jgi:hypothetical protein
VVQIADAERVGLGSQAEFAGPNDQRFVEQSSLLQVGDYLLSRIG